MAGVRDILTKWLGDEPSTPPAKINRKYPDAGDVVMAYVPSPESPNRPGTHLRPALVLHVREHYDPREQKKTLLLQVVPARDIKGERQRAHQFELSDRDAYSHAGLRKPAQFNMRERVIVPWSPKYISPDRGGPILGKLRDRDFERLRLAHRAWLIDRERREDLRRRDEAIGIRTDPALVAGAARHDKRAEELVR